MSTVPLAEARAQLSRMVDDAVRMHERFEITRNGRRAAVLLSADDYDTMQETIEVLADRELLVDHRHGQAAVAAGDAMDASELEQAMRDVGRLPP